MIFEKIRLLATDLDGTLLDRKHMLSKENKLALEALADRGIILVTATGRSRSSIPDAVTSVRGMKYLITANGAKIFLNDTGEILYEKYLSKESIDYVMPLFADKEVLCEAFWSGAPHVEETRYRGAPEYGIPFWFSDYFFNSRVPVSDFKAEVSRHKHEIENINFVFANDASKARVYNYLSAHTELYELTTSLAFNFEIGGLGVSKATALAFLGEREGISPPEIIAFGDNDNDVSMIEYAGIGVATENGASRALAAADFVTKDCDSSGVAFALRAFKLFD